MRKFLLEGLLKRPLTEDAPTAEGNLATEIDRTAHRRLGRSLAIRMVDAGSCNGCELEIHALGNPYYDLDRLGLHFVASPRHADILMVTGPVTHNMKTALRRSYDAMPAPKWVVSVGDCALDGGCFRGSYAIAGGVDAVIPVDLHIPGCAPSPVDIMKGLLTILDSATASRAAGS